MEFIPFQGKQNTEFLLSNSFYLQFYGSLCPGDGCNLGLSSAQTNFVKDNFFRNHSRKKINTQIRFRQCYQYMDAEVLVHLLINSWYRTYIHTFGSNFIFTVFIFQFVLQHYGEEIEHEYFGEFVTDTINPEGFEETINYELSRISAPITLHISLGDDATSLKDIAELRSNVKSIVYEQIVEDKTFMHGDFGLGITANSLVYSYIVDFWKKGGR